MRRFHVHLTVAELASSIDFYTKLFGQAPTKTHENYAKWMLEEPLLNFAISARGDKIGLNHFGFQVETAEALQQSRQRAEVASAGTVLEQGKTTCCYANSEKHWTIDPQGIAWEQYRTLEDSQEFGYAALRDSEQGCCIPNENSNECCG